MHSIKLNLYLPITYIIINIYRLLCRLNENYIEICTGYLFADCKYYLPLRHPIRNDFLTPKPSPKDNVTKICVLFMRHKIFHQI